MKFIESTTKEIIDTDFRQYAMYVLENRAIPSVIDGFKPVHRKLVYSMLNDHKGKRVKVADLASISKCVAPETVVKVNGEYVTVAQLADSFDVDDVIEAYDETTNEFVNTKLLNVIHSGESKELISIELENGEIFNVTPEHMVLLETGSWTMAKDLAIGDCVKTVK